MAGPDGRATGEGTQHMIRFIRRGTAAAVVTGAALLIAASPAFATDCVIGVHSTKAPASSNWMTFTALDGAADSGFLPACQAQIDAGYAALRAANLPLSLKVRADKEIGANSSSPRMADGHGLDHFDAGTPYPDQIVGT